MGGGSPESKKVTQQCPVFFPICQDFFLNFINLRFPILHLRGVSILLLEWRRKNLWPLFCINWGYFGAELGPKSCRILPDFFSKNALKSSVFLWFCKKNVKFYIFLCFFFRFFAIFFHQKNALKSSVFWWFCKKRSFFFSIWYQI